MTRCCHSQPRALNIRILYVTDAIREPLTGVGRTAMTHLRELAGLGAEVIGLDVDPNPIAEAVCGRVEVLPFPARSARMGRWHLTLLRRILGFGVDHDVLFDPTGYPNAFGRHPAQAVLVHDLSMFDPTIYRAGKRTWFRLFYRRALRKAQLCICVSEHTRRQLLDRFVLVPERCVVVPNSLDPLFGEKPAGAPHPGTPEGEYLLTVGTIEPRKNVARLLTAFAATDLPHRLVLAGRPGHDSAALLAQARALGDRVVVLHGLDDDQLRHLYRGARGLVFPSSEEGFGIPILEAMQCDIPVLTSNVSAMPEVAGDAALLVDPTDVAAIRDGIVRLATDDALGAELVDKGRHRLPEFDARRNAERLLEHLESLRQVSLGP